MHVPLIRTGRVDGQAVQLVALPRHWVQAELQFSQRPDVLLPKVPAGHEVTQSPKTVRNPEHVEELMEAAAVRVALLVDVAEDVAVEVAEDVLVEVAEDVEVEVAVGTATEMEAVALVVELEVIVAVTPVDWEEVLVGV